MILFLYRLASLVVWTAASITAVMALALAIAFSVAFLLGAVFVVSVFALCAVLVFLAVGMWGSFRE